MPFGDRTGPTGMGPMLASARECGVDEEADGVEVGAGMGYLTDTVMHHGVEFPRSRIQPYWRSKHKHWKPI